MSKVKELLEAIGDAIDNNWDKFLDKCAKAALKIEEDHEDISEFEIAQAIAKASWVTDALGPAEPLIIFGYMIGTKANWPERIKRRMKEFSQ